jgi:hypothetical protein
MKVIGIILIIMMMLTVITAVAFANESVPSADAEQDNTTPELTQSPGGSDFRLQWYHYIIPAVAIFVMTFITGRSIKPVK